MGSLKNGWKSLIYEWTPEGSLFDSTPNGVRNFGDALIDVIFEENHLKTLYQDTENAYCLIGSVICNEVIEEILRSGYKPIFLNCGSRGEDIDPDLAKVCDFYRVRGPLTKMLLEKAGVEVDSEFDPGYYTKIKVEPGKPNAKVLLVPHILDPDRNEYVASDFGTDWVRQPSVYVKEHTETLIKEISGSRFVLTGSLHAAIVAHAFGVPFAPFSNGYVDCPFKWMDWATSVGINDIQFFTNVNSGREWHRNNVPKFIG